MVENLYGCSIGTKSPYKPNLIREINLLFGIADSTYIDPIDWNQITKMFRRPGIDNQKSRWVQGDLVRHSGVRSTRNTFEGKI